ncbi:MAG: DnaJ domain-containing protein [Proteobacteria bacterium]|nr:DnaJ domain-containing protein [Pseudomonadota bacterium]
MNIDQNLKPVAKGDFSKTPFAHILVYLWERRMGGTLVIEDSTNKLSIYFREGTAAKVNSSVSGRNLGKILNRLNLITEEQLSNCEEEISKMGGLQGQILIRQGAIDAQTLIRGLREQMLLKLTDVFAMTGAKYAFYEKVNLLIGFGPDELFPIDPYPVLMTGMRVHGGRMNLDSVCKVFENKWVSAEDAVKIRRFRLNRVEKALLEEMLASPQSYNKLIEDGRHNKLLVQYTLYVLMIIKLLVVEEKAPQTDEDQVTPDRPSQLDSIQPKPSRDPENPEIAKKRTLIMEKAADIASQNYYEMLGLPSKSSTDDVQKAYFRMVKEYHPDKIPRALVDDLKDTLQYIFSNLSEAHATLIDPDSRKEYEDAIEEGEKRTSMAPSKSEEAEVRDALQAENLFQKALVFLRRGQLDKAEECIDKARKLNSTEGEYLALWAHLQGTARPKDAKVDDLIDALRRALDTNPKSERINLYLAQLLKRIDHEAQARLHFEKVLETNSRNIEAARELRLMEMRKKKDQEKPQGILKRFFK